MSTSADEWVSQIKDLPDSAGFKYFQPRVPGVPLRSTPGRGVRDFMLTPASRVDGSGLGILRFSNNQCFELLGTTRN
jgi:hypothetical protein